MPEPNMMRKARSAEKPDNDEWRRPARKRPAVEQRAKKDGEEAGLEQLHFPAVAVPILPDMDEGHVENPEQAEQNARLHIHTPPRQESATPIQAVMRRVESEELIQKSDGRRRNPPNDPPNASRTFARKLPSGSSPLEPMSGRI